MQQRDYGFLASRILALYVATEALRGLPDAVDHFTHIRVYGVNFALLHIAPTAMSCIGALLLWSFADLISASLIRNSEPGVEPEKIDASVALSIALVAVGTLTCLHAAPWLVHDIYSASAASSTNPHSKATILSRFIELAAGVWLVLGSRGIAETLRKIRGDSANAA